MGKSQEGEEIMDFIFIILLVWATMGLLFFLNYADTWETISQKAVGFFISGPFILVVFLSISLSRGINNLIKKL